MRAGLSAPVRSRCAVALALVLAVPVLAACTTPPVGSATAHDVAWVATGASVTLPGMDVTPVHLGRQHVGAGVLVGSLPSALAYAPGGGLLVVTQGDDTLHEIDPVTHDVVHSVGVGVEPDAVAVAPGGTGGKGVALVANLESDTVTPVDLGTWQPGSPITVGSQPVSIAVSAGASGPATAFVADFGSDAVTPIDLSTLQPGAAIAVGPGPEVVAVAAGEVLVGNFGNRTLTPVSAATLRAGPAVALPLNPTGIAVAPSGATSYVCGGAGMVPVSTFGLVVGGPINVPGVAQGIALTPDATTVWITEQAGSLVPVTLATGTVGPPIHVGGHPSAIVIGAG